MLSFDEMVSKLRASLPPSRFVHRVGVMDCAVSLALIYGADVQKSRIAGLLHDCAKPLSAEEMLKAIDRCGIELYEGEEKYPALLHAPAGSAVAREEYGVTDEEILRAIRRHTVGAKDMGLLDTVIYVADYIEPNRKPFPGLEEIRDLAEKDLMEAKAACADRTREYCEQRGLPVFSF